MFKNNNYGFTLVELMAIVVVIGIMSGLAYADFDTMRDQLALKRASYQLAQDIRKAQEMAMSNANVPGTPCVTTQDCSGTPGSTCQNSKCYLLNHGFGIFFNVCSPSDPVCSYLLYADTSNTAGNWGYYNSNPVPGQGDHIYQTIMINERAVYISGFKNLSGGALGSATKVSVEFVPPNPDTEIFDMTSGLANSVVGGGVQIILTLGSDPSKTKCVSVDQAGLAAVNDTCANN